MGSRKQQRNRPPPNMKYPGWGDAPLTKHLSTQGSSSSRAGGAQGVTAEHHIALPHISTVPTLALLAAVPFSGYIQA